MAEKKAATKKRTPKKLNGPSQSFSTGKAEGGRVHLGHLQVTETYLETIKDQDEDIRLPGEQFKADAYTGYGPRARVVTQNGTLVPVYVDAKGVYIAPNCGDTGMAISHETLAELNKAVQEFEPSA